MKIELKRKIPLVIALISGLAAIFLLKVYLEKWEMETREKVQQQLQKTQAAQPKVTMGVVLVAKRDIPAQTPIMGEDLAFKQIPTEYIQPGAVTAIDQVIGQISMGPIAAEEQILGIKLQPPGNVGKSLSEITPEGKRAVTVPIEDLASIINLLKPGDFVDIHAFIALPKMMGSQVTDKTSPARLISLFQDAQILAIGDETTATGAKGKAGGEAPKTVTFALTPQESALLSFVQEHGKIKISLRSSSDVKVEETASADWDTLLNYLSSTQQGQGMEGQPVVEIYRGLQKEVVPLAASNKKEK